MYHYQECGLENVYLKNGFIKFEDPEYGECVSVVNKRGLHELIASNIVENSPSLTGDEIKFLRKQMNLSQSSLAKLFSLTEQTVRRWEKNETQIPSLSDAALRTIFLEAHNGSGVFQEMLAKLAYLEVKARMLEEKPDIEFSSNGQEWAKAA